MFKSVGLLGHKWGLTNKRVPLVLFGASQSLTFSGIRKGITDFAVPCMQDTPEFAILRVYNRALHSPDIEDLQAWHRYRYYLLAA